MTARLGSAKLRPLLGSKVYGIDRGDLGGLAAFDTQVGCPAASYFGLLPICRTTKAKGRKTSRDSWTAFEAGHAT